MASFYYLKVAWLCMIILVRVFGIIHFVIVKVNFILMLAFLISSSSHFIYLGQMFALIIKRLFLLLLCSFDLDAELWRLHNHDVLRTDLLFLIKNYLELKRGFSIFHAFLIVQHHRILQAEHHPCHLLHYR